MSGGLLQAACDGAGAVILLGGVIALAQWILRRIYGEDEDPDRASVPPPDRHSDCRNS